jgi:hypothetical protein
MFRAACLVAACLVMVLAGGCGDDASDASTQAEPPPQASTSVTTAVVPPPLSTMTMATTVAPTPELRPVARSIPEHGIAVVRGDDVVLLDFEGRVVGRVLNATIDFAMEPGGPLLLASGPYKTAFRLEVGAQELVRNSRKANDVSRFADVPKPPITPGYGSLPPGQDVDGHWRWVGRSPGSGTRLGAWSAECEVSFTFFIDSDGTVRSVLGGDWILGPNTYAAGWAPDGRAVVRVAGESACGTASPTPGLYLIDPSTGSMTKFSDDGSGVVWGAGTP